MIPFSDEELIGPVKESLKLVEPMLKNDGGGMEFLGVKNGVVFVRLTGKCDGCGASHNTLKYGIERQLRNDIHPLIEVRNVQRGEQIEL